MAQPMEWSRLLSTKRMRALSGGLDEKGTEHRTEFQRDYDRVVFSSPVRRLQDKAQVFPLEPNDSVRTRLTHSLEVSTLSRGIVIKSAELLGDEHTFTKHSDLIQTIAVTAGLLHDLGNPPFGHFGESAIQEWFDIHPKVLEPLKDHAQLTEDFKKYEGNARTLRLLCNLQILADRSGLNLTAATLSASMKYVASSTEANGNNDDHGQSKPGYFFSEARYVKLVRNETGTDERRNPITFLVEAADDAVYSMCDLEDAVKKGLFTWLELRRHLEDETKIMNSDAKNAMRSLLDKSETKIKERLEGEPPVTITGRSLDDAYMQMFRILGHTQLVEGTANAFRANYDSIMRGEFRSELLEDDSAGTAKQIKAACKRVGQKYVYGTRENLELELRGRTVIHDLMDLIWHGINAYQGTPLRPKDLKGKCWNLLSETYRAVFENDWANIKERSADTGIDVAALEQYYKLLLLADYVAGMTDGFACNLHRSIKNA